MIELPGVVHLGRAGWWVGAFDARDRHRNATFAAEETSWPAMAAWFRKETVETGLTIAGDRGDGLVAWLRGQGFEVTVVAAMTTRVTVASLRTTAQVMASTGGAHDWITVPLHPAGLRELTEALGAYPVVRQVRVYDAYGTSGPVLAALTGTGWSPTLEMLTGPWSVSINSTAERRVAYAHQSHVTDQLEATKGAAGDDDVRRWIADLGRVKEIIVSDPGTGSVDLAAALRADGYQVTEKRRPAGPLVAPPGATYDGVQAQLTFRGSGWLDITFRINDDERLIDAGWLTSAWADTLTGLTRALRGQPAVIVWSYEPGTYQLVITPGQNGDADVHLRILRESLFGEPDQPGAGELQGRWTLPVAVLARAFSSATHQVIDHLDPDDVVAAWPKGIPHAQLNELDLELD